MNSEPLKKPKRNLENLKPIPFTKDNQPDPELKRKGWKKRQFTRDVLKGMLNLPYKFTPDSKIKEQLIQAFGKEVLEMSVGEVMGLQQMQKAILKGDTNAFANLINQAYGFPKEQKQIDLGTTIEINIE